MTSTVEEMLKSYRPQSKNEYEGAIQEIMQELTLVGLWRAKFFEHAAFYGGTSLRILHGLNRFSEDLDFSLLKPNPEFNLEPFLKAIEEELTLSGLTIHIDHRVKRSIESIRSAFLKAGTLETFIQIGLSEQLKKHTQSNEVLKIKLEIDINPPQEFTTEIHYLTKPFPFSVRAYTLPDLFAGKMHALLCRPYKIRVKGRDWYDWIWYTAQRIPLHLTHLEARLRQSGHYVLKEPLTQESLIALLRDKIANLNIEAAKEDIRRFIRHPKELDGWSKEFFLSLLKRFDIC